MEVAPSTDARLGNLSVSGSRTNAYAPAPQLPHLVFSRPGSAPVNMYGSFPTQQIENPSSMLQNLSIPQSSIQSIHPLAQLQPLQPPQLTRPPQPPQHLRPPMQPSQQLDQGVSLQSPGHMQIHSLQMLQQPQASPMNTFYQSQQQEFSHVQQQQHQVEHAQPQIINPPVDTASQQQQDPGMSLHEYFKSPEAIQVFGFVLQAKKFSDLFDHHLLGIFSLLFLLFLDSLY